MLNSRANFSLVRRTRLVRVSFQSPDPEFAVRACNAYAAGAEASARAENRATSDGAVAWLEAQAKAQKQELEAADKALLDARQKYQMDVLEGQRQTVQGSLLSFNEAPRSRKQAALEQKLLDALGRWSWTRKGGGFAADIPRAADVGVAIERWRTAVTERDSLLSRYTAKHRRWSSGQGRGLVPNQAWPHCGAPTARPRPIWRSSRNRRKACARKRRPVSWLRIWRGTS
jgi:hypothetical protein